MADEYDPLAGPPPPDPLGEPVPDLTRKRLAQAYKDLEASGFGAIILTHLYGACAQGESSVSTGWDPIKVGFREGARSIWLEIEDLLDYQEGEPMKKTYKKRPKGGGGKR